MIKYVKYKLSVFKGWGFYSFNPWRQRFDDVIQYALQGGLVNHWKYTTWVRMKQDSLDKGIDPIKLDEVPVISALTLDNLQGVFYLCGLLYGFALLVFGLEKAVYFCKYQTGEQDATEEFGGPRPYRTRISSDAFM